MHTLLFSHNFVVVVKLGVEPLSTPAGEQPKTIVADTY
jgi:hypothetical protein